jgi:hypothetical protein
MSVDEMMINVNTHKERSDVINTAYPVVQKNGHHILLCLPEEINVRFRYVVSATLWCPAVSTIWEE